MAVFLINICKFNGCGITFPSLGDLIQHIEDTHIDYDPKVVEQKEQAQPSCLPLSYVLRFITDAARKENPYLGSSGVEIKRKLAIKHHSYSLSSSNRSNTPTGSELDEDEMIVSESEDSNDSWTTEEFSSEFIMRYGSRHSGPTSGSQGNEKPFACPVPGCKKRYKNVNGIKYHSKNGHKKDGKVRKGYKCHCGKSYKTAQGLKGHALLAHNASPDNLTSVAIRSSSPSQSIGSLSPSSISNMSNSNSSCNNIQNYQQSNSSVPNVTTTQNQSIAVTGNSNNLMRNNIGLISIKTTKSANLIAANVTANKILKLASTGALTSTTTAAMDINTNFDQKIKYDTTQQTAVNSNNNKISLPSLVNLGILTPATSPNKQQQQITYTTNSHTGDNLPLTPISPNLQSKPITASVGTTTNNGITISGTNSMNLSIASIINSGNVSSIKAGGGMHLTNNGDGNCDQLIHEET